MKKNDELDMSQGALFPKLILFIIPLMLTNILQLAFNTADLIVVGRFLGDNALAAVGSNNAMITLLVCILMGLTMGVSVLAARYYGAKDEKKLQETVQTSLLTALVLGSAIGLIGIVFSEPLLRLMKTPEEITPMAVVYLKIFFCGTPAVATFNFAAAILRAVGDTRHPLYYLTFSGIVNVGLNLIFVTIFHWGVASVAVATVISQCVSCVLVIGFLMRSQGMYRLNLGNVRFYVKPFKELLYVGVPAGVQSSFFSISNMIIQGAINSLGPVVLAGNSAGTSIEGFIFVAQDSIAQAALASVSQNVGAGQYQRTKRAVLNCTLLEVGLCTLLGLLVVAFRRELVGFYVSDPEAIEAGMLRLTLLSSVYFLNGCMNMMPAALRGYGFSLLPTAVSLVGICIFRAVWIGTVFISHPTLTIIFISYPISWAATAVAHYICYFVGRKRAFDRLRRDEHIT